MHLFKNWTDLVASLISTDSSGDWTEISMGLKGVEVETGWPVLSRKKEKNSINQLTFNLTVISLISIIINFPLLQKNKEYGTLNNNQNVTNIQQFVSYHQDGVFV